MVLAKKTLTLPEFDSYRLYTENKKLKNPQKTQKISKKIHVTGIWQL